MKKYEYKVIDLWGEFAKWIKENGFTDQDVAFSEKVQGEYLIQRLNSEGRNGWSPLTHIWTKSYVFQREIPRRKKARKS